MGLVTGRHGVNLEVQSVKQIVAPNRPVGRFSGDHQHKSIKHKTARIINNLPFVLRQGQQQRRPTHEKCIMFNNILVTKSNVPYERVGTSVPSLT